jgi:hypothetical protein
MKSIMNCKLRVRPNNIRFTQSKDNKQVSAFVKKFPDRERIIPFVFFRHTKKRLNWFHAVFDK